MISFTKRSNLTEKMDAPSFTTEDIRASFHMIQQVNRYLGGIQATMFHLKRLTHNWDKDKAMTILDLGTGIADIPIAISKWAKENNISVRIYALDSNIHILKQSRDILNHFPEIQLIQANALKLPFPEKSVDYVISGMFLHHLSDNDILIFLQQIDRIARKGIIINDLARHKRAYFWISILTLLSSPSHIRTDAQISILRGFKKEELIEYIQKSGLHYLSVYPHFAHRYVIAGEK